MNDRQPEIVKEEKEETKRTALAYNCRWKYLYIIESQQHTPYSNSLFIRFQTADKSISE